jgi:O-antigen/teichoic acid export membrane protein
MIESLKNLFLNWRGLAKHRPNLYMAITNMGWLVSEKVLRILLGLVTFVFMARHLGPSDFGIFNYALAFLALFSSIATVGLNGPVVRDIVKEPNEVNLIMGTSLVLQLIGGLVAFCLLLATILIVRPFDSISFWVVSIIGIACLFKFSEVSKYWFEARVQSKYVVIVEAAVFFVFTCIKLALIYSGLSLIYFAWVSVVEALALALLVLIIYQFKTDNLFKLRFSFVWAKKLLQESWPLILSGLTVILYMRIDQIMIAQMMSDESVGIYSAAVRISEAWYFIPLAIVSSVFPSIIRFKGEGQEKYDVQLQKLFSLMVLISILVAIPMSLISNWLILAMYGQEFGEAGYVLALHVWAGIFVSLGVSSGKWYLNENLTRLMFYRTLCGAVINITMNYFLIPFYGIIGATYATLISYIFVAFLFDIFNPKTRKIFWMKVDSFFFKGLKPNQFFLK